MKFFGRGIALLLALCLTLSGCAQDAQVSGSVDPSPTPAPQVKKAEVPDINEIGLRDDPSLYSAYDPVEPVCFYITVRAGSAADGTNHTFEEVNSFLNLQGMRGAEKIKANALIQVGDERGPLPGEVGYGTTQSNATINVRGRTSTTAPQKSYRISLMDNAGLWRGQRDIAINKHPNDPTRLRNMLYFELLQDAPSMVSLRTQFVHVYIKDETSEDAPDGFVDYGLFTQVELPNKRYLRNHGLSRGGELYKANMCEMYRYPDILRRADDPAYDASAFEEVLEPKVDSNHEKLLNMLDAVNDYTLPIEDIVEKYFDLDNLTSYIAFNILMCNPDSNSQNYYLYSPLNSDTWYFLCWDGDGSLSYYGDELMENTWAGGQWKRGLSNYWGVVLFNRMLKVRRYRDALTAKVEALHKIITPERIASMIRRYRKVVDKYAQSMPDQIHMTIPQDKLELIYRNMPFDVERSYRYYMESLQRPMPFFMGDVQVDRGELALSWEAAYDFEGDFVRYDVQVASDWTFEPETILWENLGQLAVSARLDMPPPGTYYWRVTATNERGFTQIAFDHVITSSGMHAGMRAFTVREDGTVVNEL